MANKNSSFLQKTTVALIAIILLLIASLVVIESLDRFSFYRNVRSLKDMTIPDSIESFNTDSVKDYVVNNVNGTQSSVSPDEILRIYKTASGLLSSNGLTYIVTLIVALLAALLLYRIQEVGVLVRRNMRLEENVKSYYEHAAAYNEILTSIESIYDLTMIISSLAMMENTSNESGKKEEFYVKIGSICSRMSIILEKVEDYGVYYRLKGLEESEKEILETYIKDTQDELVRVSDGLKKGKSRMNENVDSIRTRLDVVEGFINKTSLFKKNDALRPL